MWCCARRFASAGTGSTSACDITVAVNLSARSVDGGLPEKIAKALAEAGLPGAAS